MREKARKILVVDGNMDFVSDLYAILRRMGYSKIVMAESGSEALKLIKIWVPDVLLLDDDMHETDGASTLRRLKQEGASSDLQIIMLTSLKSGEKEAASRDHGCVGLISKPPDIESLHIILQDCVARSGGCRRLNIRAQYRVKARIVHNGAAEELDTVSLSEGGVYLVRESPYPLGAMVEISLKLDDQTTIALNGRVIYHEWRSLPSGMAVAFEGISDDASSLIRNFVSRLITGSKRPL